jgi:hypothetical protein
MLKTTGLRFALTVMMTLLMLGVGSLYAQTANPTQPVMPMGPMYNATGPDMVMNPATHMGSTNVQPMSNLMLNAHQVLGGYQSGRPDFSGTAEASPGQYGPRLRDDGFRRPGDAESQCHRTRHHAHRPRRHDL